LIRKIKGITICTDRDRERMHCHFRHPGQSIEGILRDAHSIETNEYNTRWRLSLGSTSPSLRRPTWREHLRGLGHRLDTQGDVERVRIQDGQEPQDLDTRLNGFNWEDAWDNFNGPQAKAFHLLKSLDLGSASDAKLKQAGQVVFQEFGGGPGNNYTWVELKDDVTVSLLQARLIELDLPIHVRDCGALRDSA
jgi:hypothetical protein